MDQFVKPRPEWLAARSAQIFEYISPAEMLRFLW